MGSSQNNKMINKYTKKGFISNKMHVKTISNWKKMLVTILCTKENVASGGRFGTNWHEKPLPEHANSNNAPEGNRYRRSQRFLCKNVYHNLPSDSEYWKREIPTKQGLVNTMLRQ